jgi:ATP-dependent DNA helicase HFM1/MER3
MKPNERPVLREFNKSPLIKYPIKENISTTSQKISLIIQVQLGGVELPSDKEFLIIKRQFMVDKGVIFERIQRLVRCIIDCKSVDCDGIATRHALDLARSLSAGYWENSNLQLRQIPQIGPAASRKLVAHNVHSVEEMADLDTGNLERIMSRNPPFGRKMLDSLAGFPHLTIAAEVAGRAASKAGENPKVMVKARLGFANAKSPLWNGKRPSLTFMAETSGGALVHFWRGNIQKLEKGHEVKFLVELSSPDDEIKCYVACDEIVGTFRSSLLKPDIPVSEFVKDLSKQSKRQGGFAGRRESSGTVDEFGGDEFEDDELLEAVRRVDALPSEHGSDDFADVDDLIETHDSKRERSEDDAEPVLMENGKWACNHQCGGGQALKNGQSCKHRCCHEGLDKPRKPKRKVCPIDLPSLWRITDLVSAIRQ